MANIQPTQTATIQKQAVEFAISLTTESVRLQYSELRRIEKQTSKEKNLIKDAIIEARPARPRGCVIELRFQHCLRFALGAPDSSTLRASHFADAKTPASFQECPLRTTLRKDSRNFA